MIRVHQLRFKSSVSSRRWIRRQVNDVHTKESKARNYPSRAAFKLIEINDRFKVINKSTQNIVDLGFAPGAWSKVVVEYMANARIKGDVLGVDLIKCSPPSGAHFIQGDIFSRQTHRQIREHFRRDKSFDKQPTESSQSSIENEEGLDVNEEGRKCSPVNMAKSALKLGSSEDKGCTETPKTGDVKNEEQKREISHADEHRPVDLILSDMMTNTSGNKDADHYASMDLCDGCIVLACELLRPKGSMVMKFYTGKEDRLLVEKLELMFDRVKTFKPKACRNESKEMYIIGMKKKINVELSDVFGPQR